MKRVCVSKVTDQLPNLYQSSFKLPQQELLSPAKPSTHPPRILMLYGPLRERSYSKLLTLEAARLLEAMGAEVKVFDPLNLPQPDAAPDTHPKVKELRDLAA
jgi:arsenic resistance protein ArsH